MTTTNRNEHIWQICDTIEDAIIAAHNGHPCDCPHPYGSHLWRLWQTTYAREIRRIVDARVAVMEGRIAEAEREADAADVQGSWWRKLWDSFFNTRS